MGLLRITMDHWQSRQRQIDIEVLWPSLLRMADDEDCARRAFLLHAMNDAAWVGLGQVEIIRQVAHLTREEVFG